MAEENVYCTKAQFALLYDVRTMHQLSQDDGTGEAFGVGSLELMLDLAASELEAVLAGRFALPLVSVPKILTRWVAVKAAERFYQRRVGSPDKLADDVKWADEWLELLRLGKVGLPGNVRAQAPQLTSSESLRGVSR